MEYDEDLSEVDRLNLEDRIHEAECNMVIAERYGTYEGDPDDLGLVPVHSKKDGKILWHVFKGDSLSDAFLSGSKHH